MHLGINSDIEYYYVTIDMKANNMICSVSR